MFNLSKNILHTLTWFDIFNYPLILDEIFWWLYGSFGINSTSSPAQIKNILASELNSRVQEKDGYYFLPGRQQTISIRQQRQEYSKAKMKRVRHLQQFLKYFPFIKMVALCDFMGYMNAGQESDIDLFIITEKNRLWSARFWLTGILKILNLRPQLKTGFKKDKFCLSFWISEDHINLEKVTLNFPGRDAIDHVSTLGDIYFHFWLAGLKPIYNEDNCFQKLLQENQWIKKYLPNLDKYYQIPNLSIKQLSNSPTILKKFFQNLQPQFLEKFFRWFELKWMPDKLKNLSQQKIGVIIQDNILKLHWQDKRQDFRKKFLYNLKYHSSSQYNLSKTLI